jgi:hypothetical protein
LPAAMIDHVPPPYLTIPGEEDSRRSSQLV